MNDALQIALDFVEGRMAADQFGQHVRNNEALERLLKDPTLDWADSYIVGDPHRYLMQMDYRNYSDVYDAQGAVQLVLDMKQVAYRATTEHAEFFELMLGAHPKWLDLDPTYIKEHILPEADDRKGKALQKWLKGRLRELFRYSNKPPQWLQSPEWPIGKNGPFVFLGQLKIDDTELFQGRAEAYLFYDSKAGESRVVIQHC